VDISYHFIVFINKRPIIYQPDILIKFVLIKRKTGGTQKIVSGHLQCKIIGPFFFNLFSPQSRPRPLFDRATHSFNHQSRF